MATNTTDPKNVYICGPWYGENTVERFMDILRLHRIIRERGFYPIYPAFFTLRECPPRGEYMKHAMVNLLTCQYIYLMRGWQENSAAVLEYLTARFLELQVLCDEGEFPEEFDECFPPERRYIISKDYMYGANTSLDIEGPRHHAEDNEGFQEYYRQHILPSVTEDSDTDTQNE